MEIKLLSQNLINQIAAGEVVERPASVIKEIMENAVDAGASFVDVKIVQAGKSLISVSDDGCGMDLESLKMCLQRHATSKLSSENLFDIHTFGFRGEALPSIASIARVSISSAVESSDEAWTINTEGGSEPSITPCSQEKGTLVEVRDLFFATPARLKFLKSDTTESNYCYEIFNHIALAFPHISFRLTEDNREKFFYRAATDIKQRWQDVFGESFAKNTIPIETQKGEMHLRGAIGVPTFNRTSTALQCFFINQRFVKDKNIAWAIKSAYAGLVPQGRYAVALLYLDIPHDEVDVNAHPAKTEVRFKYMEQVKDFITTELRKILSSFGASYPVSVDNFGGFNKSSSWRGSNGSAERNESFDVNEESKFLSAGVFEKKDRNYNQKANEYNPTSGTFSDSDKIYSFPQADSPKSGNLVSTNYIELRENQNNLALNYELEENTFVESGKISLGQALYQIDNTYIVAATEQSLIVVDQHAAAERITLEHIKTNTLKVQELLLEEIYDITPHQIELLENNKELLQKLGVNYTQLTKEKIMVNSLPVVLKDCSVKNLISDILDELAEFGETYSIDQQINHILSTISCHISLRAGKKLDLEEMNSLLRQMENTPNIAQCCHGRPSYIVFFKKDLNKFFERS